MQIVRNYLRVPDFTGLEAFYGDLLGMQIFERSPSLVCGYSPGQCALEFREGASRSYRGTPDDLYWKIGITVRDLDAAVRHLRQRGWPVSDPHQFQDIGYLCHLEDPQGFQIELLQQGFEGNSTDPGPGHPIGGQAILAHLTVCTTDIAAVRSFCEEQHGMRLMSVQPVPEHRFVLYFFGWSDEALPNEDLEAVENREWLWARPYTLLEVQRRESRSVRPQPLDDDSAGFLGFGYGPDPNGPLHEVTSESLCDPGCE